MKKVNFIFKKFFSCIIFGYLNVIHCAIWYHLYNLKNVRNTHGGVLILVNFTKINTPPWVFFTFFKCTNGTKLRNAPHTSKKISN